MRDSGMDRPHRNVALALILAVAAVAFFWRLGALPFYSKGEPREAVQIIEAVHHNAWVLQLRNGIHLPSKPPLFHWLGAFCALARGQIDELSARLPSAIVATLVLLLTFGLGARTWGTAAGLYAACILATNFEWLRAARAARVDMVLTGALTGAFVALQAVTAAATPSARALWALYLCIAAAVLAKGPVGVALPGLVALAYLTLRRDLGRLRAMHLVRGTVIVLLVAGTWYALAIWLGGEAFVRKQIMWENVTGFVGKQGHGHPHPFYYQVPGFVVGFLPWSPFLVPLAVYLYRQRGALEARGYLYPLVWFAGILFFFSVSSQKRTVYMLPAYPAAALLLGAWWSQLQETDSPEGRATWRWLTAAAWTVVLVFVVLAGLVVGELLGLAPLAHLRPHLHHTDQANVAVVQAVIQAQPRVLAGVVAVLLAAAAAFAVATRRRRPAAALGALVVLTLGCATIVYGSVQPALAQRRTLKPFAAEVAQVVGPTGRLISYGRADYSVVFYLQRHIEELRRGVAPPPAPGARVHVLLWQHAWDALSPADQVRHRIVLRSRGTGPEGREALLLTELTTVQGSERTRE